MISGTIICIIIGIVTRVFFHRLSKLGRWLSSALILSKCMGCLSWCSFPGGCESRSTIPSSHYLTSLKIKQSGRSPSAGTLIRSRYGYGEVGNFQNRGRHFWTRVSLEIVSWKRRRSHRHQPLRSIHYTITGNQTRTKRCLAKWIENQKKSPSVPIGSQCLEEFYPINLTDKVLLKIGSKRYNWWDLSEVIVTIIKALYFPVLFKEKTHLTHPIIRAYRCPLGLGLSEVVRIALPLPLGELPDRSPDPINDRGSYNYA